VKTGRELEISPLLQTNPRDKESLPARSAVGMSVLFPCAGLNLWFCWVAALGGSFVMLEILEGWKKTPTTLHPPTSLEPPV